MDIQLTIALRTAPIPLKIAMKTLAIALMSAQTRSVGKKTYLNEGGQSAGDSRDDVTHID